MQTVLDRVCQISNTTISLIGVVILVGGGIISLTTRLSSLQYSIDNLAALVQAQNANQNKQMVDLERRVYRLEDKLYVGEGK